MNIEELLNKLTIKEKILLLEGYDSWHTNSIPRLNIKSINVTDGPMGVRKKKDMKGKGALGLGESMLSNCYLAPVNLAQTFDTDLVYLVSSSIAKEASYLDIDLLLAPACNIKRNPRCGRNFEYYSEDPLLSGNMAKYFIKGLEDNNIKSCLKHFMLNNCENFRYNSNSIIDERALREIYLKNFEIALEANPSSVMVSYNKVNGISVTNNKYLLTDILRNELKYDGVIMTDWGATHNRVDDLLSGTDLDMPGGIKRNRYSLESYFKNNDITALNNSVRRMLNLINTNKSNIDNNIFDNNYDNLLKASLDSVVLLKNEDNILPLNKNKKYLIVGNLFKNPRYQGSGSSKLNPYILHTPYDYFSSKISFDYLEGYHMDDIIDESLEKEVIDLAKNYDEVIFVGGLTDDLESEGFDRENIKISNNQISLINKLSKSNKLILLLFGGSVMELPFVNDVKAILYLGLLGESVGEVIFKILFGQYSPNGRLSETWPLDDSKIPYNDEFNNLDIKYKESILVGYRWYLNHKEDVLYPFGYGLSYTDFIYSEFFIEHSDNEINISFNIMNNGLYDSKETVLIFIGRNNNTKVFKALKELKYFKKVFLKSKESKRITINLDESIFSYYNIDQSDYVIENGVYPIYISKDAFNDIKTFNIEIKDKLDISLTFSDNINDIYNNSKIISNELFYNLSKYKDNNTISNNKFTIETPLLEFKKTLLGKLCLKIMIMAVKNRKIKKMPEGKLKDDLIKNEQFMINVIPYNSMRSLVQSSGGLVQMNMAYAIVDIANGRVLRGILNLIKRK